MSHESCHILLKTTKAEKGLNFRFPASNFQLPTSNFQLFFDRNLRQRFLFNTNKQKRKPLKMCFPERSVTETGDT